MPFTCVLKPCEYCKSRDHPSYDCPSFRFVFGKRRAKQKYQALKILEKIGSGTSLDVSNMVNNTVNHERLMVSKWIVRSWMTVWQRYGFVVSSRFSHHCSLWSFAGVET